MTLLSYVSGYKENITVIGKARYGKAAALVISKSDGKVYELDGIAWDEEIVGKTVKVSGKLFIKYTEPQKPGEPIAQTKMGITRIILKPKWELIR